MKSIKNQDICEELIRKQDEFTGQGSVLSNMPPSLITPLLIQATKEIA